MGFDEGAFCVGENWVDMNWEGSRLSYDQDGPRRKLADWIAATHGTGAPLQHFSARRANF